MGPAAISNAIEDALAPFGVRVVETPLGPAALQALVQRTRPATPPLSAPGPA